VNNTQLLCTFCTADNLDDTLLKIVNTYTVAFETIYILENSEVENTFCCTYNIDMSAPIKGVVPEATISLHRKKSTNTLYTINALNLLISELNGGRMDKNFKINWDDYKNTILVTAYNKLKKINTKLNRIVKVEDILKN
jgi:hypothetical protein